MTKTPNKQPKGRGTYIFYAAVALALCAIIYYTVKPASHETKNPTQTAVVSTVETTNPETQSNQSTPQPEKAAVKTPEPEPTVKPTETPQQAEQKNETSTKTAQPTPAAAKQNNATPKPTAAPEPPKEQKQEASSEKPVDAAIKILKSQVTSQASFYPYKIDGINMEVIAVKASDGTIRTALNTCQVCFDSGRGYYVQVGNYLVCQNCKNKFHIDQVEKVKGGCNPVPVMEGDKTDTGDSITISKEFLAGKKELFTKWKKQ